MVTVILCKETMIVSTESPEPASVNVLHDTLLLLAREQEWAEAYCADHPKCELGLVYLDFLRREIDSLASQL